MYSAFHTNRETVTARVDAAAAAQIAAVGRLAGHRSLAARSAR